MQLRLFICFFLLSCSLASCVSVPVQSAPNKPVIKLASGVRVLLIPGGDVVPTQATLDSAQTILAQRLATFGLNRITIHQVLADNQQAIQVEVPHFGGDEYAKLRTLLGSGQLEFWNTHSTTLPNDTVLDPLQFAPYNAGGVPLLSNRDLDLQALSHTNNTINIGLTTSAQALFKTYITKHKGDALTITLDRKIIQTTIITPSTGTVKIAGQVDIQQSLAIFSVLKYAPLPVKFRLIETLFSS